MTVLACTLFFICGLGVGILNKGITINIVHKPVDNGDKPVKYNESLANMLPAEVQQYYQSTHGANKF